MTEVLCFFKQVQKLNKIMELTKSWHFTVFPKYDFEYFNSKVSELGNKPAGRVIYR